MDEDRDTNMSLREINLITLKPIDRIVGTRTIHHRIIASYRGYDFFDGERDYGYGGLKYDGSMKPLAEAIVKEYAPHTVLQINCEKGFLLCELQGCGVSVKGIEPSSYARRHITYNSDCPPYINYIEPAFKDDMAQFDLVIALGVVYTLNLPDAIQCLKKINQLGHRSFITLATYETDEDYKLMRQWSLLGTTLLKREEWIEVMKHAGYSSDFQFIDAQALRLRE